MLKPLSKRLKIKLMTEQIQILQCPLKYTSRDQKVLWIAFPVS